MTVSRIPLSNDGPEFSRFAAGFWRLADWNLTSDKLLELVEQCLALGVTTVDHADLYGDYRCEQLFGEALSLKPSLRDQMEVVTKCGICPPNAHFPARYVKHYDTGSAHILASVDSSLAKLRCDYLDLLLIHRPDPLMDPDDIAQAFTQLRTSGKVRHFGVSNFTPSQFALLQSRLDYPLVTNQVEISPLATTAFDDGTLDQCLRRRIAPMAWSCLGGGRILHAPDFRELRETLARVSEEVGAEGIEQVIYAWLLALPAKPIPIIGSGKIERIASAVGAERLTLDRQQWFSILEAAKGEPVP